MDATAPTNPAGVTVPEEAVVSDMTGDLDTESARSRSVLGPELQVITAREGQVALTEAALAQPHRLHADECGVLPSQCSSCTRSCGTYAHLRTNSRANACQ